MTGILVSLLFVPPVNFLFLSLLGAAFARRRAGRVLLWAGLAGLLILSLPIVSQSLIGVLEAGLRNPPAAAPPAQAIVILSGDEAETLLPNTTGFRPGPLTLEREQAGAALARATHLPVLVSGGAIHPWSPPLARIMAESLTRDFGVDVTWQEDRSLDTWGNARETAALLRGHGITRVFVVTHAWHMRRALVAFRRAGLDAVLAPVAVDNKPSFRANTLVPAPQAWLESFYALHELVGLAWYELRP